MRDKSILFVDPATMEGYLFLLAHLKQDGIPDINTFFSRVSFSGSHASTIFAVLDGRADIGAAKNTTFDKLVKNDPSIGEELQILEQSPKVPEITLCIKSEVADDLRAKLSAVLLDMDKTPLGAKVLRQFEALRFVKAKKADFDTIEAMALEASTAIAEHGKD